MGTVADVICDVCEESSRYTAPFLDVTLTARRAIGRIAAPHPPLPDDVDPLLVALATRGVLHGADANGEPLRSNTLTCGGCCSARLLTAEGRVAILSALDAQGKLGPLPPVEAGDR